MKKSYAFMAAMASVLLATSALGCGGGSSDDDTPAQPVPSEPENGGGEKGGGGQPAVQGAVTGLSAEAGDGSVTLSWTNPTNAEFENILLSYTPDDGGDSEKSLGSDTSTYTYRSLENGTEYTFSVTAVSSSGTKSAAVTATATPKAAETLTANGVTLTLSADGSHYTVTAVSFNYLGYSLGTSYDIAIPASAGSGNLPVTAIAADSVGSLVTSLYIPSSVATIESGAFSNASKLTDIYCQSSKEDFAKVAGSDVATGLENVTMHYESYGANADANGFQYFLKDDSYIVIGYTGSATEIVIPSSFKDVAVTALHGSLFKDNTSITSVSIPETITSLGNSTLFSGCTNLTSVYYNAKNATSATPFDSDAEINLTIGKSVEKVPLLFSSTETALKTLTFEEGSVCTELADYAFYGCTNLQSVTLPDSLVTVGKFAFSGCTGLTEITVGEKVTTLGERAFYGCTSVEKITYNANATISGTSTSLYPPFYKTAGEVTIGKGVSEIPDYLFYNSAITNVTFEAGSVCTSFGRNSFYTQTLTEIEFPAKLATVGSGAIYTSGSAFKTIHFNAESATASVSGEFKTDTVIIGKNVTKVQSAWFYGNGMGIKPIHVIFEADSACTEIGSEAFKQVTSLVSIDIPESVSKIGDSAFYGDSNLTTVTGLRGVTSVGASAFASVKASPLYFANKDFSSLGSSAFSGYGTTIYVYFTAAKSAISGAADTYSSTTVYYGVTEEKVGEATYSFATVNSAVTLIKAEINSERNGRGFEQNHDKLHQNRRESLCGKRFCGHTHDSRRRHGNRIGFILSREV